MLVTPKFESLELDSEARIAEWRDGDTSSLDCVGDGYGDTVPLTRTEAQESCDCEAWKLRSLSMRACSTSPHCRWTAEVQESRYARDAKRSQSSLVRCVPAPSFNVIRHGESASSVIYLRLH